MKYQAIDEIEQFSFEDCVFTDFEVTGNIIRFTLEALIVKPRNSQNTQFTESYADTTELRLINATIVNGVKEGFKYYDADGNLLNKVDDEPLENTIKTITSIKGSYLFAVEKKAENTYVFGFECPADPENDKFVGDSYIVEITFDKSVFEWERYMNRVQR